MRLKDILKNIEYKIINGNINIEINGIEDDSRQVKDKYLFISIFGFNHNGHNYIKDAINNGANSIIICEDIPKLTNSDICIIKVASTTTIENIIAKNFYQNPQEKLIKIAITGTKGKTTTSQMIKKIIDESGSSCGYIGTNGIYIKDVYFTSNNTTPKSLDIFKYMSIMVKNKIKYLVMEVSSQALKYNRVIGLTFDYAIFTNLSKDHIGEFEHSTMEDYITSKAKLFKISNTGIFNIDDKYYLRVLNKDLSVIKTYGLNPEASLNISTFSNIKKENYLGIKIETSGLIKDTFIINMPGLFNAYNATSAILICHLLGINTNLIKESLEHLSIPGRSEIINIPNGKIIIDYAHNGTSAENILKTVIAYHPQRIITVFGCGGNRSKTRRYEMGNIISKYSNICIITEDNNRYEKFRNIAKDILVGIKQNNCQYKIISKRSKAIKHAIKIHKKGDIILLLGKGHENYIEVKGKKYHFDEREIINDIISSSNKIKRHNKHKFKKIKK